MALASRNFNRKQALEKELKDLYVTINQGTTVAATATLSTTSALTVTNAYSGSKVNTNTITINVAAAAPNPTDTILAVITGTASAMVITLTPNDGTNNTGTPVTWTSANLNEFLNTGAVTGKTVTVTDAGSLRTTVVGSSTGGNTTVLTHGGNGDGVVGTFSGGNDAVTFSGPGVASVTKPDSGDYLITLQDKYVALKYVKGILKASSAADIRVQVKAQAVDTGPTVELFTLTGATPTDLPASSSLLVKLELKNSSVTEKGG